MLNSIVAEKELFSFITISVPNFFSILKSYSKSCLSYKASYNFFEFGKYLVRNPRFSLSTNASTGNSATCPFLQHLLSVVIRPDLPRYTDGLLYLAKLAYPPIHSIKLSQSALDSDRVLLGIFNPIFFILSQDVLVYQLFIAALSFDDKPCDALSQAE